MNTQNDFLDNLVDDEFDVDSAGDLNAEMCSSLQGDTEKMCSSLRGDTCGVSSIAVKGTEVNSVNSLRIKHFWVFGQPSEGCLDTRIFLLWEYINRHFSRSS